MKRFVPIIGILITIIGWITLHVEQYPFTYRIVAPRYSKAIYAFNRMRQNNFILRKGDVGFSEIAEILKEFTSEDGIPTITQIKTLRWKEGRYFMEIPEGVEVCKDYFELEVSFSNRKPTIGNSFDLEWRIKKKYLSGRVFAWSNKIFWIGITISIISIFLNDPPIRTNTT